MCVVQRSQKQKRERERERERDDEKRMLAILSRSLCSSFLRLFFSRVHRALFEETLKAFLWECQLFFSSSLVSFFKNFSRICLTDALEKNDKTVWPKKKKIRLPSSSKKISKKRGVRVKYAATKNNDDDEYDGWWCWTTGVSSGEVLEKKKTWRCMWKG